MTLRLGGSKAQHKEACVIQRNDGKESGRHGETKEQKAQRTKESKEVKRKRQELKKPATQRSRMEFSL